MRNYDHLIFELSKPGRAGYSLPTLDVEDYDINELIPEQLLRKTGAELPEVSENQVVRHYVNLSNKNYGVDTGFYPLGSCTMKYNPKINEDMASIPKFSNIHPLVDESLSQGTLELLYNLAEYLSEITGMKKVSLNPFAGAHGELIGLMIIKAYHEKRGDSKRTKIIVPDSAHGTNPASATVAGFDVIEIKSNEDGTVNIESLKENLSNEVAGIMLTNPNTLGIFEKDIVEVQRLVHEAGGLSYYDGANLNAIMGTVRPGDMGFDVIHLNLHKTFSTPHGGGGPGSGPVGVSQRLVEFLPVPEVIKEDDTYRLSYTKPNTIGRITSFYGNVGILVRAYTYILSMGSDGLKHISRMAVLSANYLQQRLKDVYQLPIDDVCKHEFVLNGLEDQSTGVTTLDIAKLLLDYGFHSPTIYFPLIVKQAMMIEPTESESLEMLDHFVDKMKEIAKLAIDKPDYVKQAPHHTVVRRLDEATAARKPIVKWTNEESSNE
ncbi:aminomethyl-transferring glycine dehydrogenase subunit GcvPB [Haloplasma contractile]|uniref:Probable glycine dehydrogenase (decarboxylating) subunit 2 n=1 Tax=Haloplasma contractile SSD-17B TaxID=1033810 RepID=U2EH12_9MOLU|nr:aminomethyl-transferring glycine dehydrogenase subunit GcvPB [Haloplasma contractile]ERJ13881.1 putative glycine dehydrogenase decarboxylating subunit 2 protein [Haloplasma contractile SSD-17B]